MIELKNITKKYSGGKAGYSALENVNLRIEKGEFCSVGGASGAGKSTLLYTIGGLIQPDAGEVNFKGRNIYDQGNRFIDQYRKDNIGFMFQQFHLMPYLTVSENISLGCHQKSHHALIDFYMEKCSLVPLKNKYPSELSVGEKQRTAFIRAIISDPEMLLADEPTGNLDPGNAEILMSLVEEYHQKGGTVVMVSHHLPVPGFSTTRIMLEKGKIVE